MSSGPIAAPVHYRSCGDLTGSPAHDLELAGRRCRFRDPLAPDQDCFVAQLAAGRTKSVSRSASATRHLATALVGNTRSATRVISHGTSITSTSIRSSTAMCRGSGIGRIPRFTDGFGLAPIRKTGRATTPKRPVRSASGDGFRSAQPILRAPLHPPYARSQIHPQETRPHLNGLQVQVSKW